MRLIFAGTPGFAERALGALHRAGHEICAVLTQPDRAAGRGLKTLESPVKIAARALNLAVVQPESLKKKNEETEAIKRWLASLHADLMVVAAYGLILPADVLRIPRFGCLNIHASLLPRWRGAAPIQRALKACDADTGICLMQMDEGLDTGPVWRRQQIAISGQDNFQTLHDRLADLGADMVVEFLRDPPFESESATPQQANGITYAEKITARDLPVDWERPAKEVSCHVRALDPVPGATGVLAGQTLKLFEAKSVASPLKSGHSGQIIKADAMGLWVACADGAVSIGALQRPGGRRLSAGEFLNGHKVLVGDCFAIQKEN